MSAKRSGMNPSSFSAKKPFYQHNIHCPNPFCRKGFASAQKLHSHLSQATHCAMFMTQLCAKQQFLNQTQDVKEGKMPASNLAIETEPNKTEQNAPMIDNESQVFGI